MGATTKVNVDLATAITKWLGQRISELAALIAELVAIPTENPPGRNYRQCADILERHIREAGLRCERFEWGRASIPAADEPICLTGECGQGKRTLFFHGHYDVVPAQSAKQFAPRREGNFLFGRGSCDMKGGVVAMLYALRALKECQVPLSGNVALTVVPDEETGGARGSTWLASKGLLGRNGIGMLTAEPTSGVVWNANRGAITLRVDVRGKSAHVGLQHQGQNAFERMHVVVEKLLRLKREVEKRQTAHSIAGRSPSERIASTKLGPRNSILLIGGASGGGTNFNVVPDCCWFTADRRINPEEDLETEKRKLIRVLEECRREGISLEWQLLQEGTSAHSAHHEPLAQALAKSVKKVTGKPAEFEMCPGLLETRFYAARGIPAFAYGPGLLSVAHGPNEYVDLRRVQQSALIYALTAAELLKPL